jgi:AcrR family transcriptional regulator
MSKESGMGVHERREREKELRKEAIVDAAQKIFFERGLLTATMDEIAEVAELSKGTLYLYYKSKEDLYLAVVMRGLEELHQEFRREILAHATVVEQIFGLLSSYVDFFRSQRNWFKMSHFMQATQFHKQVSDDIRDAYLLQTRKLWDLATGLLQKGMQEGVLRSDLNPIHLSILLWSSVTSLLLRIDAEAAEWKERMHIDLWETLELSNRLLMDSVLTEQGRTQRAALQNIIS